MVDQYCCLVVDRRAVDVVGRRSHCMVHQVGGGWERVREVGDRVVGVRVVVATVERGVWRDRQSTYQVEGQQGSGDELRVTNQQGN